MPTRDSRASGPGSGSPPRAANGAPSGARRVSPKPPRETYVAFTETDRAFQTNCYFIRREGNGAALRHLQSQLAEMDEWLITDGGAVLSGVFKLDLDNPISAATVGEILRVETNGHIRHEKLGGKMVLIDLFFTEKMLADSDAMARRASSMIGRGRIARFFDKPSRIPLPLPGPRGSPPRALRTAPPRVLHGSYAVLTETNGDHQNDWYFVRLEGNESVLGYLQSQLEEVGDWSVRDSEGVSYGAFELDLDHPVSAATAEVMVRVRTNGRIRCTRLDGRMSMVDFGFTEKDRLDDEAMTRKVFDMIGCGNIGTFFD